MTKLPSLKRLNKSAKKREKDFISVPHGPEDMRIEIAKSQEEFRTLHAVRLDTDNLSVCCYKLSWRARLRLLLTGKLWYGRLHAGPFQPLRISTHRTDFYFTDEEHQHLMDQQIAEAEKRGD